MEFIELLEEIIKSKQFFLNFVQFVVTPFFCEFKGNDKKFAKIKCWTRARICSSTWLTRTTRPTTGTSISPYGPIDDEYLLLLYIYGIKGNIPLLRDPDARRMRLIVVKRSSKRRERKVDMIFKNIIIFSVYCQGCGNMSVSSPYRKSGRLSGKKG